jgi:hypothetical protein
MKYYVCRIRGCDDLTGIRGGCCAHHAAPRDIDLDDDDTRDMAYRAPFDDDIARMSAQERYDHPENQ